MQKVHQFFGHVTEFINQIAFVWVLKSGCHSVTLAMKAVRSSETSV